MYLFLTKSGLISGVVLILKKEHSSRYGAFFFFQPKNTEIFFLFLYKKIYCGTQ